MDVFKGKDLLWGSPSKMSIAGTAGGRIAPGVGANLIGQHAQDRNQDATVYVGNLDPQVSCGALNAYSNVIIEQGKVGAVHWISE